ncbi:SRPBCC family protein [Plantactinospora siamensis]|uniref:SRPBCC family protein n=1 Tax=Plantactinospora siamensis TaxID=555372 RepID=A0ABV6NZ80_9ACTN
MRYVARVTIEASAEEVWQVLSDVRRWPEWTPTMSRVEVLEDGPLRVGSRARVRQPRLREATWTVCRLEPGRSFAWVTRAAGLRCLGDHVVTPGPDGTHVELVAELTGPFEPLTRPIYGRLFQRYVETEGASLKRLCESGVPGRPSDAGHLNG